MTSNNVSQQYASLKTSTGFRLQNIQNQKKEFSRLNESFNELKDKIQDAQGTKFQFYRLSKQKNEQKQQRCDVQMSRECGTVGKRTHSANYYDPSTAYKLVEDGSNTRNEIFIQDVNDSVLQSMRSKKPPNISRSGYQSTTPMKPSIIECQYCSNQNGASKSKSGLPIKSFNTFTNAKRQINDNNSTVFTSKCTCQKERQRTLASPYNPQLDESVNIGYNSENMSMNLNNSGYHINSRLNNNGSGLNNMKVKVSSKAVVNSLLNISAKARSLSVNNNQGINSSNGFPIKTSSTTKGWNIHVDNHDKTLLSALDPEEINRIRDSAELIHSLTIDSILDLYTAKCQDNQIEYIPEQAMNFIIKFKKICKKRQLHLSDLALGKKCAFLIAEFLKEGDHFSRLYLDKNQIGNSGAYYLSLMFGFNTSLIHLDISGNNIGPEGFEILFRSLISNCTLISLDVASKDGLNRNRIGQAGANQLEQLLKFNTSLQFLNLSCTSLSNDQLTPIMRGLNIGKCLTMIDLSYNDLDPAAAEIIVNKIQNSSITELYLSHNLIGDNGLAHFLDVGLHSKFYLLETLDLSHNNITSRGLANFLDSMHKNQNLHKLFLNDNNLSGIQINKIVDFLQENTGLQHLYLERCDIQPEGIGNIAHGLDKNKTLTHLYLKENRVRNQGAKCIADTLSHKSHLQVLDLSLCKIEDEGGIALAQVLVKLTQLHTLNLRENSLHDVVGAMLCSSLEKNTIIRKLNVERNPINYSYQERIKKGLLYNQNIFEQKKIPLFIDILQNMKGKSRENDDLDEQQEMKGQQFKFLNGQVENLKNRLQKMLHDEEMKMNAVEAIKKEVQGEYDHFEKQIANQKKEQDSWLLENRDNADTVERNTKKQMNEKNKIISDIAARKQYYETRRQELLNVKLNLQSKVRDAETSAKQSDALCSQAQVRIEILRASIEQKKLEIAQAEQSKYETEDLDQQPKSGVLKKANSQGLREVSQKKNKK